MFDDRYNRRGGDPRPEQPRSEPEIIPPDRPGSRPSSHIWFSSGPHGTERIYIAQPGPFSVLLALIIAGLVVVGIALLFLGLVLFWVPVLILVIAALFAAAYLRTYWRRLQFWLRGR